MSRRVINDVSCAAPGSYLEEVLWPAEDDELYFAGDVIDQLAIELAQQCAAQAHRRGEWLSDFDREVEVDDLRHLIDVTPDLLGRRVTLRTERLERYALARLRYELDVAIQDEMREKVSR